MEILTKTFKQRFQYRDLWGTENHWWNNGAPNGVYLGTYTGSGTNTPEGIWTAAWFLDCMTSIYAYSKYDEDPTDTNAYVHINIHCYHNKFWSSVDVEGDGYIDIGALYLDPDNPPAINPSTGRRERERFWTHVDTAQAHDSGDPMYLNNNTGARNQLEADIGVSRGSWLGGILSSTAKVGQTITPRGVPDSGWGTFVNGVDSAGWDVNHTLVFPRSAYDQDGKMKLENVQMPFYIATRYSPEFYTVAIKLSSLFDFDLVGSLSPFNYIPWGIKKSGTWETCNRRSDGLSTMKSGSWSSHIIINSPLNPNVPGDSSGFRKVNGIWRVSPLTPDEE